MSTPRSHLSSLARRSLTLGAVLAAGSVVAAGCSSGSDDVAGSQTSATSSPSAAGPSPSTTSTTTGTPGSSATSSGGSGASGTGTTAHACTSSDVTLAVKPAGAAAGHVLDDLVATTRTGHSCTLRGYPGVSLVATPTGAPIGHPAVRVRTTVTTISLGPGQSATSAIQLAQAANYGDRCTQRKATGLAIYLPDQRDRLFVAASATACAETSIELLQVKPFAR